jgi:CubicO group peptidase (beta-lactamase class C family)
MRKVLLIATSAMILLIAFSCQQETKVLKEAPPASVSVSPERLTRIDKLLQESVDSGWIAGATALISRDGKIVYDKAFGVKDLESKSPMLRNDIFRIASQTKAITSIAVMMLFEDGKFLLDDPISKYIPEFADPKVLDKFNEKDTTFTTIPAKREVTIRDLLTHTSGIDYAGIGSGIMNAVYAKAGVPAGFVGERILLADKMKILGKQPLVHQPGEKWTYGLNVDVLGYLVEVLSGESLESFFKSHIFEPLGMNDTYFYIPKEKQSRLVKVCTEDKFHKVIPLSLDMVKYPLAEGTYFSGGAGLSSTTEDYAKFLQMLLNKGEYNGKRLLARHTVDLITTNQIGNLSLGTDKFGLGFELTTSAGAALLGISEGSFSWGGYFATTYWADPKEKIVGLLFFQQMPLTHTEIQSKFKALVYQSLDD